MNDEKKQDLLAKAFGSRKYSESSKAKYGLFQRKKGSAV